MRNVSENQPNSTNHLHLLKSLDLILRLLVIPLSAASIWVTVTTKQDNTTYGNLEFKNLTGLKYMVCINAISAVCALVAMACSWLKWLLTKAWVFFVSDQVVSYLLVTSVAAVIELLYLAQKGDKEVSWSEACSSYGKFCNRVMVALILHVIPLFCFLVLSIISAFRVFSKFEPPSVPSKGVEEEEEEEEEEG